MTPHPDRTAVPHPGLYIGLDYRELSLILEALEQYVEERSAPQYARVTRDARALAARLSVDKQRMEEPR